MKEVQIVVLLSGVQFIANIEYIPSKDNENMFGYYDLDDPLIITPKEIEENKVGIMFSPWVKFGNQKDIKIGELAVATTVDPIVVIKDAYLKQVNPTTLIAPPSGMKIMK